MVGMVIGETKAMVRHAFHLPYLKSEVWQVWQVWQIHGRGVANSWQGMVNFPTFWHRCGKKNKVIHTIICHVFSFMGYSLYGKISYTFFIFCI